MRIFSHLQFTGDFEFQHIYGFLLSAAHCNFPASTIARISPTHPLAPSTVQRQLPLRRWARRRSTPARWNRALQLGGRPLIISASRNASIFDGTALVLLLSRPMMLLLLSLLLLVSAYHLLQGHGTPKSPLSQRARITD